MRTRFSSWIVLATAATALGMSACAGTPAQLKSMEDSESETVQLGVSRIPRTVDVDHPNRSTFSPVTIVTEEELKRTGAVDLREALRRSRAGVFLGR